MVRLVALLEKAVKCLDGSLQAYNPVYRLDCELNFLGSSIRFCAIPSSHIHDRDNSLLP